MKGRKLNECQGDWVKYLRHLGARIGEGCSIYTHDGTSRIFRDCLPGMNPFGNRFGAIVIHDNCFIPYFRLTALLPPYLVVWGKCKTQHMGAKTKLAESRIIGNNAILLPGIEIGPDPAVGAGSVVTKTVPPRTIVAGNPAHPIKALDEYIQNYFQRMIPLEAMDRQALRKELTTKPWGEER